MGEQKRVTVLGGGQLCSMLGKAALEMGNIVVTGFDPLPDACAGLVCTLVVGSYDDEHAVGLAIEDADVVTYEFENVSSKALAIATRAGIPVHPSIDALVVAGDRLKEKELVRQVGCLTPAFAPLDDFSDLENASLVTGFPAVIKTRRGGYDGKGQCTVHDLRQARAAFEDMGGRDLIMEAHVAFEREHSMIVVRGQDGSMEFYPLTENQHRKGILRVSRMNAASTTWLEMEARMIARRLAERLNYVGVLAVEFFEQDGVLLVNEIAPRVHNSGHGTIEGAETSQFKNHLLAILGMPLGSTEAKGFVGMVNCVGFLPDRDAILAAVPEAHIHFYGKDPRPDRKLGHITVCCSTFEKREEAIKRLVRLCDPKQAAA